jgi:hypothetical protein
MFVLDGSATMEMGMLVGTNAFDTRWHVLTSALSTVLPSVDNKMAIGALIFPAPLGGACSVPQRPQLAPATGNVASLVRIMNAVVTGGSTPIAAAIDLAAEVLLGLGGPSTGRVMVLATDGGPNCNAHLNPSHCRCSEPGFPSDCSLATICLDDTRTIKTIANRQAQGLPTYVIGIEDPRGSDFSDVLNAMAVAGGRARSGSTLSYYQASSQSDLNAALTAIRDQVGNCTYLSTSVPGPNGTIVIAADNIDLSPDEWMWGDRQNGEIVLLGDACQAMGADSPPRITATVACGS